MTAEEERTRLIGDIARVLRDGPVPDEARAAALTFIGWLARRMPGEPVSHCDIGRCKGVAILDDRPTSPPILGDARERPPAVPGDARERPPTLDTGYQGPPSGSKPRGRYLDGSEYEASNDQPRSAR